MEGLNIQPEVGRFADAVSAVVAFLGLEGEAEHVMRHHGGWIVLHDVTCSWGPSDDSVCRCAPSLVRLSTRLH